MYFNYCFDKRYHMEEDKKEAQIIEEREKKAISFLKVRYNWIAYASLALLVWFAVWLRTLPMKIRPDTGKPGLWDITTDNWTLGPDLDPFLFLRWAKDIVLHGSIMANDALRYVPLGFNTSGELTPLSYMIAYFHNILTSLGLSTSIEYSAVLFPAIMFGLTVIAFFLLTRQIFVKSLGEIKANIIAIISSFFLIIVPSLLPRTIAGIPEKESAGFFFLFASFYLFICAWDAKNLKIQIVLSILAGITTAGMAGVWGGYTYIFLTLGIALLLSLILGQTDKRKLLISFLWLFTSFSIMGFLSNRYTLSNLLNSTTTLIPVSILMIVFINFLISETSIKKYFENNKLSKIPKPILSIIITFVLGIVVGSIMFGPSFIIDKTKDITTPLITPITSRLGITVAENRQPFFDEWAHSFGPVLGNDNTFQFPVFFWLFFVGSVYLYMRMMNVFNKKERIILTSGYFIFLFAIIFSRFSPSSVFNGTNIISLGFYVFGVLCLVGSFGYYYFQYYKQDNLGKLGSIDFSLIVLFSFFFFGIISARGSVRTIMVLVPPTSIIVGFFITDAINKLYKIKNEDLKIFAWLIIALLGFSALFVGINFYKESRGTAQNYIPSVYTQQWQLAMSWIRENTQKDAVFGHWWDYGYWVQTMGERATVLDGGNAIVYWNYLMGRYGLTSPDEGAALEFLYTHNTTHFLIDSTDIGKYGAFSSIGSDENYDRTSYLASFFLDKQQIQENKNSTSYLYQGGVGIDDDIVYEENGTKVFLPGNKAALGAIIVEKDKAGKVIKSPVGIFVYQQRQYKIPFRYAYSQGSLSDFGSGIESGIFLYPVVNSAAQGVQIEKDGALLYLSKRTVNSQLARLFLYKEDSEYFKLVHSEDDFIVTNLKNQNAISQDEDFVQYQGLRGPIRIWEISYPENIKSNHEYLLTHYPNPKLSIAK